MGFGVPGAIGAQIGTGRRPLVLCGDGAFQMTGPEIAQAPRHGCNPIVLVVNNGGWGIFRPVADRQELLERPGVAVRAAGRAVGRHGVQGGDRGGAAATRWRRPSAATSFVIIEVMVSPHDLSPVSRKYIAGADARQPRGREAHA